MYTIRIDRDLKAAFALIEGVITVEEVDRFNIEMAQLVQQVQQQFGVINVITDTSTAPVQPTEAVSRYRKPGDVLKGPRDKYAAIVSSTLAKLQGERVLGADPRVRLFLTRAETEAWIKG